MLSCNSGGFWGGGVGCGWLVWGFVWAWFWFGFCVCGVLLLVGFVQFLFCLFSEYELCVPTQLPLNHWGVEVGRNLWRSSGSSTLLQQGHLGPAAQDCVQMASFEYLQGWKSYHLSGQTTRASAQLSTPSMRSGDTFKLLKRKHSTG